MFKNKPTQNILAITVIVLFSTFAYAEDNATQQLQDEAKKYSESMPTGSVPATNILGVADSNVPRVTNFKSIGSQLSQGLDKDGKIKNALGFEVAPYLLANDKLKWDDYYNSPMTQILTRTTVSFAAIPASDGKTASSAFGAQSVLYSEAVNDAKRTWGDVCSSAMADAATRHQNFISDMRSKLHLQPQPGETPDELDESKLSAIQKKQFEQDKKDFEDAPAKCQAKITAALQRWNATVVAIGLGAGFFSPDSNAKTLKTSSSVYWLTAAYG